MVHPAIVVMCLQGRFKNVICAVIAFMICFAATFFYFFGCFEISTLTCVGVAFGVSSVFALGIGLSVVFRSAILLAMVQLCLSLGRVVLGGIFTWLIILKPVHNIVRNLTSVNSFLTCSSKKNITLPSDFSQMIHTLTKTGEVFHYAIVAPVFLLIFYAIFQVVRQQKQGKTPQEGDHSTFVRVIQASSSSFCTGSFLSVVLATFYFDHLLYATINIISLQERRKGCKILPSPGSNIFLVAGLVLWFLISLLFSIKKSLFISFQKKILQSDPLAESDGSKRMAKSSSRKRKAKGQRNFSNDKVLEHSKFQGVTIDRARDVPVQKSRQIRAIITESSSED